MTSPKTAKQIRYHGKTKTTNVIDVNIISKFWIKLSALVGNLQSAGRFVIE